MPKESPREVFNGDPTDGVGIAGAILCSAVFLGFLFGVIILLGSR